MISDVLQLFLDTNIWLSFYSLTRDDLEELRKVGVLIDNDRLKLYVTDQVRDEFRRNRENKFAAAMKKFTDGGLPDQIPQFCKDYESEFSQIRSAIRSYKDARDRLVKQVTKDFEQRALKADEIIELLFDKAIRIEVTDEMIGKAHHRQLRGNPPGKGQGAIGDEINWECLLASLPQAEDLYVIADDEDWRRSKDGDRLKPYLQWEWQEAKTSQIFYYRELTSFFKEKFPDIKLAKELEKEIAVKRLVASTSTEEAKAALRRLSKHDDFSTVQMDAILGSCLKNVAVCGMVDDKEVEYYLRLAVRFEATTLSEDDVLSFYDHYFRETDVEAGLISPSDPIRLLADDIPF